MGQANGSKDLSEERQARGATQSLRIAVVGYRPAIDELHGQERDALRRHTGIVEPRDVLMLEPSKKVAFALEAARDRALGLEAGMRNFERYLTDHRGGLFSQPDSRHATGPNRSNESVGSDQRTGFERGPRTAQRLGE